MKKLLFILLLASCQPAMYKGVIIEKQDDDFWNYRLHSSTPMVIDSIGNLYGVSQWNPYRVDVGGTKKQIKKWIKTWE